MESNATPNEILESLARKRVKKLKDYYIHLALFVTVILVYISKTYLQIELDFFPFEMINYRFTVIWAAVFIAHSVSVFLTNQFFGRKWEQNAIQKQVDSSNKEIKDNSLI